MAEVEAPLVALEEVESEVERKDFARAEPEGDSLPVVEDDSSLLSEVFLAVEARHDDDAIGVLCDFAYELGGKARLHAAGRVLGVSGVERHVIRAGFGGKFFDFGEAKTAVASFDYDNFPDSKGVRLHRKMNVRSPVRWYDLANMFLEQFV
mmetsp:Transcript_49416/g.103096  ORF Transcript_49416/g.103096 Transcript_49416/m.103096 type:complete len:151 (+) Transcript_49416:364-816(+)